LRRDRHCCEWNCSHCWGSSGLSAKSEKDLKHSISFWYFKNIVAVSAVTCFDLY
jgi:hypothetical protein